MSLHIGGCPRKACGCYTISAYEPDCPCSACTSGKRWFQCYRLAERHIADYVGSNEEGRPASKEIAYVRAAHPTADLVYLD